MSEYRTAAWLGLAATGWLLLCALTAGVLPPLPWPLPSVALSLLLTVLLPGALLLHLFGLAAARSLEAVPLAFLLGLGLWSAPAVVMTAFLHASLGLIGWLLVGATGALLLGACWSAGRGRSAPAAADGRCISPTGGGGKAWVAWIHRLVGALAVALMVALALRYAYPEEDRLTYLAFLRHILDADAIYSTGFIVDPAPFLSARDLFQPWLVVQGLIVRLAAVDLTAVYDQHLPLLLIPLSYAGLYLFSRELFNDERAGHLACVAETLLLLASYTPGLGRGFLSRIGEDKFLAVHVLLWPALWLSLRFLRTGERRFLAGLAVGMLGMVLVHPLGAVFLGVSLGALVLPELLVRRQRPGVSRALGLLALWAAFTLIPLWQRQQVPKMAGVPTHYTFDLEEGLSGPWKKTREGRLAVLSSEPRRYVVSPQFLSPPLVLLALLLAPLLLRDLRRSRSAAYLLGTTLLVLLLCYVPWVTPLLGKALSPWMLWRLTWLLPTALTLVYFGLRMAGSGRGAAPAWRQLLPLAFLACCGVVLRHDLDRSLLQLQIARVPMADIDLRGALDHLRARGVPKSRILTPETDFDNLIPAHVGHSFGLTFRRERQVAPGLDQERKQRFAQDLLDAGFLGFLRKHEVDILLLERGTRLASLCRALPEIFPARYANDTYVVHGYRRDLPPEGEGEALQGYTRLSRGDLAGARAVFEERLARNPADMLGRIGMCDLADGAGDLAAASSCFGRLADALPDDVWILTTAGNLARKSEVARGGDGQEAQVGFYLRAIRAAPGSQTAHRFLRRGLTALPALSPETPGLPELRASLLPLLIERADQHLAVDRFQRALIVTFARLGMEVEAQHRAELQASVGRRLAQGERLQQRIAGLLSRAVARAGKLVGWDAASAREARPGVSAARC